MSIEEIFSNQKNLIKICKKYLNNVKKDKIDIITSPLCFFTTWADTPGNLKVNDFCGVKNKKKIIFIIKNLLTGCKYFDLKLFHKKNCIKKYDNLIVSYSQKNDFDSDGNFLDRYFNYDDKDINSFWILISLDNYVPSNFKSNISIIAKKKKFSFSFGYLFKELFKIIGRSNFNFKMLAHNCWSEYIFAQKIFSISKSILKNIEFKNIIMNYEGIPFQNNLINEVKKISKKIRAFGYLHCAPWPLQTELIYKKKLFNKFIVSGEDQKKVLNTYYGWKNSDIKVVPSLRFNKTKKKEFTGSIFLPFNLIYFKEYLNRFEMLLQNSPNNFFNNLYVRIHPLNIDSKVHKKFSILIHELLLKYKDKFSNKKKKICIFFGSATGVSIQALEEGNEIIHFPLNEILDVYSPYIWENLSVKKIEKSIYKYKILKKDMIFKTTYEKKKFQKYIIPIIK